MLTRSQVAARLGRSLATIRRLEGKELHPEKDGRGVNRFDAEEVQEVAQRLATSGTGALADGPLRMPSVRDERADEVETLRADVERLRLEVNNAGRRAHDAEEALGRYKKRTSDVFLELCRELAEFDVELVELVVAAAEELDVC